MLLKKEKLCWIYKGKIKYWKYITKSMYE